MKTNYLLLNLALVALLFASCQADDTADIIITDNSTTIINNGGTGGTDPTFIEIGGTKIEDFTLETGTDYVLSEALTMTNGTTLTIPAGTVIKANNGAGVYIAIAQGAKINAEGTSTEPIVLTSNESTPNAGDWVDNSVIDRHCRNDS